jgi:hypothetical protein
MCKSWLPWMVAAALLIFGLSPAMATDESPAVDDNDYFEAFTQTTVDDEKPATIADDIGMPEYGYDKSGKAKGKGGSCRAGAFFFDVDLTYVRFFQEGGVTDIAGDPGDFNMKFAPRFELGWFGVNGMGVRMRYWNYDQNTISTDGDGIAVDTFTFDLEIAQKYEIGCLTTLETFGGVRYVDFQQGLGDLATDRLLMGGFTAAGGTVGFEGRRHCWYGNVYARGRLSVLYGDSDAVLIDTVGVVVVDQSEALGNIYTQTELGIGYEVSGEWGNSVVSARVGAEWHHWANAALADTSLGGVGQDDQLEDVGFAGLVLGLGVDF